MKIKVGDTVTVIAGTDKGKTGKVIKTLKNENRVIVEGVHVVSKHIKPGRRNETGGILKVEAPIHASNVKKVEAKPAAKASATKTSTEKAEAKAKTTKTTKTAKKETKKESEK